MIEKFTKIDGDYSVLLILEILFWLIFNLTKYIHHLITILRCISKLQNFSEIPIRFFMKESPRFLAILRSSTDWLSSHLRIQPDKNSKFFLQK